MIYIYILHTSMYSQYAFLIHETYKKNIHILRFSIGKSVNYILTCCQVRFHNSSLRAATKFKIRILRGSTLQFCVLILF